MAQGSQPVVSGSAVASAGLASAVAALVTSKFGVAGTLLGAALTTMIITGGSAVLKSYLEGVTGRVRKMPGWMRSPRADEPPNVPARPDLRNNFMGRLRAAFDWFLHLPPRRRQAILAGAIVPAVVAFLISMGAVTALEVAIGKSLPCGIWNNCPTAAVESGATTSGPTRPTLLGGGARNVNATQNQQVQDFQQQEVQPGQNVQPGVDPNAQPVDPGAQPADPAVPQEQVSPEPAPSEDEVVDPVPAPSDQAAPPVEGTPAPAE